MSRPSFPPGVKPPLGKPSLKVAPTCLGLATQPLSRFDRAVTQCQICLPFCATRSARPCHSVAGRKNLPLERLGGTEWGEGPIPEPGSFEGGHSVPLSTNSPALGSGTRVPAVQCQPAQSVILRCTRLGFRNRLLKWHSKSEELQCSLRWHCSKSPMPGSDDFSLSTTEPRTR